MPAARSASSGTRIQPPRPITTAAHRRALLADAAVADVDDAVGDLGRARIVADDERRHSLLPRELGEELVDDRRVRVVELAGRLVGDQEPRPVGERSAQRDALLLAAGQLAGMSVRAVAQTDALEQLACARARRSPLVTPARPSGTATSSSAVSSPASARQ